MSRPLRVHVVVQAGIVGGAERLLVDLLAAARPRLDLSFECLADGPLIDELRALGPVRVAPVGRGRAEVARGAVARARAWRSLEADVVLANGVKAAAVAAPPAWLAGLRVVWLKHDFAFDRWVAPLLGRLVDGVVAVSDRTAAATGRRDAAVVTPPRPAPPLPPESARAELQALGLPATDRPIVATVGRLVAYKGVDDVIAAVARAEADAWHLAVIGLDDPAEAGEGERLARLAHDLGVGERVTFLGGIPAAGRLLSGVDAVAVVTKTDERGFGGEGYGLVAAEAMAAGVPIVATPDAISGERLDGAGILVAPGAPDAIADALGQLVEPAVRERLGARGRRMATDHPAIETCAGQLASALAQFAARPGSGVTSDGAVSVVTTVLDEGFAVDDLIELVLPQLRPGDELVVVDGGSTDDTVERVLGWNRQDPRVRLVEAPGTTIAAGRNAGIKAARHDFTVCIDAGCAPWPGWLDALRAAFAEQPQPDLVTGVYAVAASRSVEHAFAAACYPSVREARRPGPLARVYGAAFGTAFVRDMPTGRSLAFRRVAWSGVGGFRETLETAEDVTFGRSVAAAGGRCLLALDAGVTWHQRRNVRETAAMYFRYGRGSVRSRDRRLIARDAVRAGAYLLAGAVLAGGRRRSRMLVLVGGLTYLSLPFLRVRARPKPLAVALLVPAALALKDVSKAAGMLAELSRSYAAPRLERRPDGIGRRRAPT